MRVLTPTNFRTWQLRRHAEPCSNARNVTNNVTTVNFGTNSVSYSLAQFEQATEIWNVSLAAPGQLSIGDASL